MKFLNINLRLKLNRLPKFDALVRVANQESFRDEAGAFRDDLRGFEIMKECPTVNWCCRRFGFLICLTLCINDLLLWLCIVNLFLIFVKDEKLQKVDPRLEQL